jgi:hypothetical protein
MQAQRLSVGGGAHSFGVGRAPPPVRMLTARTCRRPASTSACDCASEARRLPVVSSFVVRVASEERPTDCLPAVSVCLSVSLSLSLLILLLGWHPTVSTR